MSFSFDGEDCSGALQQSHLHVALVVQVVRQLPLHQASFRPVLIGFEHQHLSAADLAAATALLHTHDYAVVSDPATLNTFALALP